MTAVSWLPASLWQASEADWRGRGTCARMVADAYPEERRYVASLWYPVSYYVPGSKQLTAEAAEAVGHCRRCPVRLECELKGMSERDGIWAGLLPQERQSIRRRALRQAAKQRQGAKA